MYPTYTEGKKKEILADKPPERGKASLILGSV